MGTAGVESDDAICNNLETEIVIWLIWIQASVVFFFMCGDGKEKFFLSSVLFLKKIL